MVARGRFELPSEAPEASMIDRYTTGLNRLIVLQEVLFSLISYPQKFLRDLFQIFLYCNKFHIDSQQKNKRIGTKKVSARASSHNQVASYFLEDLNKMDFKE